jgi:hypothetical protein
MSTPAVSESSISQWGPHVLHIHKVLALLVVNIETGKHEIYT